MNKDLKLESEKIYPKNPFWIGSGNSARLYDEFASNRIAFVAGATSNFVEKQKLLFAIEQLNNLDTVLQQKISLLSDMSNESSDKDFYERKISGIRLAKEEIRRDIRELEQNLKQYEN